MAPAKLLADYFYFVAGTEFAAVVKVCARAGANINVIAGYFGGIRKGRGINFFRAAGLLGKANGN